MTVPLMERLDIEVETARLAVRDRRERGCRSRRTSFGSARRNCGSRGRSAADWPAPINLLRERQRRRAKIVLTQAAVAAGVATGVGLAWQVAAERVVAADEPAASCETAGRGASRSDRSPDREIDSAASGCVAVGSASPAVAPAAAPVVARPAAEPPPQAIRSGYAVARAGCRTSGRPVDHAASLPVARADTSADTGRPRLPPLPPVVRLERRCRRLSAPPRARATELLPPVTRDVQPSAVAPRRPSERRPATPAGHTAAVRGGARDDSCIRPSRKLAIIDGHDRRGWRRCPWGASRRHHGRRRCCCATRRGSCGN